FSVTVDATNPVDKFVASTDEEVTENALHVVADESLEWVDDEFRAVSELPANEVHGLPRNIGSPGRYPVPGVTDPVTKPAEWPTHRQECVLFGCACCECERHRVTSKRVRHSSEFGPR